MTWHGIIIDKSLKDASLIDGLKILGTKEDGDWKIYKVEVEDDKLQDTIQLIQPVLSASGWYVHFYNDSGEKLVVVFRNRTFELVNNPSFWKPAIDYGKSLGMPEDQLDFMPNKFDEEDF